MNKEKLIIDFLNDNTINEMRKNFRKNLILLLKYYLEKGKSEIPVSELKNHFYKEPWYLAGVLFQKEHEEFIKKHIFKYKNISKSNYSIEFIVDLESTRNIVNKFSDFHKLNGFSLHNPSLKHIEEAIVLLEKTKTFNKGDFKVDKIKFNNNEYPAKRLGQIAYAISNDVIDDYLHPYVFTAYGIKDRVYKPNDIEYISKKDKELKITEEQESFFYELAKENNLLKREPYIPSGRKYYQIYPKDAPSSERMGGTHYEFEVNDNKLIMVLHLEPRIKNIESLKKKLGKASGKSLNEINITDFSEEEIRSEFNKMVSLYEDKINSFYLNESGEEGKSMLTSNKLPLNQILYGPPGTGKTYNTINKAIEIIDNEFYINHLEETDENRKALKDEFKKYIKNGQIVFVTFHQSYGYEEFVEGIKAIPAGQDGNETDNMIYSVVDGIFKKISNDAKPIKAQSNKLNFNWNDRNIFKMSLGGKNDSVILDWCLDNNYISMGWGNELDFSQVLAKNWETFRDESKSLFRDNEPDRFTIQVMYAFKEWMKKDDLVFVSSGNLKIVAIGQVVGEYEYKDSIDEISYSQFRKVKWLFIDKSGIPTEKLLTKKLSQQTIYNLDKSYVKKDSLDSLFGDKENVEDKNYVLIIDEINRGNISKIFGELITLIEDSKRVGNSEPIEITLPYSGDKFSVPNNLYILGTMNTADRSIALMDTALRRRFHFEEMMPDLDLLSDIVVDGIKIDKVLENINKRIEYLYDRDHTIGHAYFISLKDIEESKNRAELDNIFRNKVIPLLQEYFYDDWGKIRMVLGDGFIKEEKLEPSIFDEEFRSSDYIEDENFNYIIAENFDYSKLN